MTAAPTTTCYRHPDRPTGRHCTRCGRPACGDCLVSASVGAQCVDCVRAAAPTTSQRVFGRWRGERLAATKAIIAINVAAFVVIALLDGNTNGLGATSRDLALFGPELHGELWRLVTSSVVHYGVVHLAFNMFVLYQVGVVLEPGAGKARFSTLYFVSVLGGAAGAAIMTPSAFVGGASGGVFGIAAAATLVLHRQGVTFWNTGFGPLLAINLGLNLFMPHVSIGGHVGGLIAGALAAEGMMYARRVGEPRLGYVAAAVVGIGSAFLALAVT
jgi:membrane associated rhomboid family serine protease